MGLASASGGSRLMVFSIISRLAAKMMREAAHAAADMSAEDAKRPMMRCEDVALMSGMSVKGSCRARTTCATTSILRGGSAV